MKILVAEDEMMLQLDLEHRLLNWGYEPVLCSNGDEAWTLLQQADAPAMMILDWNMPGQSGIELCKRVREQGREPEPFILMLTARGDSDDIVTALDAGADDFVGKPFNRMELKARLTVGRRMVDLQQRLLAMRDNMQNLAEHDLLTGLWNHAKILKRLNVELERASRKGQSLAVVMSDIDFFKRVNDEHGHQVGDEVLSTVAGRLTGLSRSYDSTGRYGGEEFLMVLPESTLVEGAYFAERVRTAIGGEPVQTASESLSITMSLGVSCWSPGCEKSAAELVNEADQALYRAKHDGRNRVSCAVAKDTTAGKERSSC